MRVDLFSTSYKGEYIFHDLTYLRKIFSRHHIQTTRFFHDIVKLCSIEQSWAEVLEQKLDNHVTKSSKFKAGTSFFVGDWSNLVLCLFEVGNYLNTEVRQINFTLLVIQDLAYKVYHTQRLLLGLLSSIRAGEDGSRNLDLRVRNPALFPWTTAPIYVL